MKPDVSMSFAHSLGRAEAKQRLQRAVEMVQTQYGSVVTLSEVEWSDDGVAFAARALAQTVRGRVDVDDTHVTVAAVLPLLLKPFASRIQGLVADQGVKLLR